MKKKTLHLGKGKLLKYITQVVKTKVIIVANMSMPRTQKTDYQQETKARVHPLTFLRSRGGSLRARMMSEDAEGMTSTRACLFWMISFTVTLRLFQSEVAFMMSSPTFLGDRPKGPILGAREEVAATSPPTQRRHTVGRGQISELSKTSKSEE